MPLHYRREWNESRGDEYADWGTSIWYFEVDDAGNVLRQIEVYQIGRILRYDQQHLVDAFGMLADQALDPDEFAGYVVPVAEFEAAWNRENT